MEKFAFIIHPLSIHDMAHVSPVLKFIPDYLLEKMLKLKKPFELSHITGIKSPCAEAEGWFIGCPLTSKQMVDLPEEFVMDRIIESGKIAEELGAKIVGLGAFTSIVGDAGITVAKNLNIAVTSGNSYTVATALDGVRQATKLMGKDLASAHVTIVGASGSIGAACTRILAREAKDITMVARRKEPLEELAHELVGNVAGKITVSTDIKSSIKDADVVIAVTSAVDFLIEPNDLKVGAIVCDVARPRNVSREVAAKRQDVLVIEGGVIKVPGNVDFHFNFGFPPQTSFACMAETMILALEKRYENFTLGRKLTIEQIDTISSLAKKHDFKLAGFRNFERAITEKEISVIQKVVQEEMAAKNI